MKKLLLVFTFLFSLFPAAAQKGPLAYILPASTRVIVVLGDTPREVAAFRLLRRDPGERDFRLLTPKPVEPVSDPHQAVQLMGRDYPWIARRMGTEDPGRLWRKLNTDRSTAMVLCLVSHGLRMAMGRTVIDMTVEEGKTYRYRVELLDRRERLIDKVEKNVLVSEPKEPPEPGKVSAAAGDGEVTITWDYRKYRGGEEDRTVGFNIYREEMGREAVLVTPAPVLRIEGWLSYIDKTVENGRSYTYSVAAVDVIGVVSKGVLSDPVLTVDNTPPLIPMGMTAVDEEEGVLLVWRLSPDLDISHYNVYRGEKLDGEFARINTQDIPFDRPRYTDRDIIRGIPHYYQVSAVDRSGNESPQSGPAAIIPRDSEPPPKVEGLSFTVDEKKRSVTLTWEQVEAGDLSGYHVFRGRGGENLMRITAQPVETEDVPSFQDTGYKEKGLYPGETLLYAVSAVDRSFNEGEKNFIEVFIPDNVPPTPPFYLTGKSTEEGHVRLNWQPSLSRDLDLHRIYRKEDREFDLVAELPGKDTSWLDEGVARGRSYTYRVTEVDTSVNESEPSKEVVVVPTDMTPPSPPTEAEGEYTGRGVSLNWQASSDYDVAGYHVYRAEYPGDSWKILTGKPVKDSEYFDRRGKPGNSYGISALDTSGNEGSKREIVISVEESGE